MDLNAEGPVVGVEETLEPASSTTCDSSEPTAAPPPPSSPPLKDDIDPFYEENNGLFEIMKLLNFTVRPMNPSNSEELSFDEGKDGQIGERQCSTCTGEKHVDELFKKLEADMMSEKEREIEQLTIDLKKEREAGVDFEKKLSQLVEFISFMHGEFGKLVRSFVLLTTKNLDVCNVLNLGPFQDEKETDEFLEGLNSLAKQLLNDFENFGDTRNLLERINEILKANVDANPNINVPEDFEDTCSQEYENVSVNDRNADVRIRSRSSVSTVIVDPNPEISDKIGENHGPPNPPPVPKVRVSRRKKVIKTEHNLESVNKIHGMDFSKRHRGHFCLCGCKYSSRRGLGIHIQHMTSEWLFECNICKKRFMFASYLRFHLNRVHGIVDIAHARFTCSQCGQAFDSRKENLEHHWAMHRNKIIADPSGRNNRAGGRIRCGQSSRGDRLGPKDTGTRSVQQPTTPLHGVDRGSAAIQCICGNIYSHRSALSLHISTKLHGKVFRCQDCGKRYDIHGDLKKHVILVHKKNYLVGKFGCSTCGKPFDSMMDLRRHRNRIHGIESTRKIKKISSSVPTELPEEAFLPDDPPPPMLLVEMEPRCGGEGDGEVYQSTSNVFDADSKESNGLTPPPPLERERQSLPAPPPVQFQVDEDANYEIICVE